MNGELNLTQSQLLIWTGQKLNPERPLYNMALLFELAGEINPNVFEQAFQKMVDQTDSMRIIIREVDKTPQQTILPKIDNCLEFIDFSKEQKSIDQVLVWAEERCQKNFDLTKPMFDAVLIKINSDCFYWFFNQHHLITDGWSVTLLYKRLAEIYAELINDQNSERAIPSYISYLEFEKTARLEFTNSSHAKYWQQKNQNLPEKPDLFGIRSERPGTSSKRVSVSLGIEKSDKLRTLSKETDLRAWTQHLSMFNIFSTVLFSFVYRISNQKKLTIGTPAHNRVTPDFKNTSGLFIELFPLETIIEQDETFSSLFKKMQWETSDFLKNAVPGSASNEISRGFNVVLNYINATFSDFAGIPMKSTWIHPANMDEAHNIRLQVHDFDSSGEFQLHFDLNTDYFSEEHIENIPRQFLLLLDQFVEDRFQKIENPQIVESFHFEQTKPELHYQTIIDLFKKQVELNPTKNALEYNHETTTYENLDKKSNEIASYLIEKEISKNNNVVAYLPRTNDLIAAILGILKAGGTFIPVDSNFTSKQVTDIISDAEPLLIITNDQLRNKIDSHFNSQTVLVDDLRTQTISDMPSNTSDKNAYLLYTSGSTGLPKGVIVSHQNLSHYIQEAVRKYGLNKESIIPLFTSIGFDLTITSIFGSLISGGLMTIYEEEKDKPDLSVFQVLEDNRANFIKLTPSHLSLLENSDLTHSSIKTMVVGGEDFKIGLASKIQENFGKELNIYNEYGPTEATVGCIVYKYQKNDVLNGSVPIGQPMKDVGAYVLNNSFSGVPAGVPGELYLSGPGIATGYWKNKKLSEKFFIDYEGIRLYKTGDLVRLNNNGDYEFLGRVDEQIKLSGKRVEPGEIENAINAIEGIDNSVVTQKSVMLATDGTNEVHCVRCGLPSNYPESNFDNQNICKLCRSFESYQHRVKKYFKTSADLERILKSKRKTDRKYDCISLLSGGKDSTYALAKLVEMGLNVLAFTLDNGYISTQAKNNINRVVKALNVDHIYGSTPAMNEIFVDSLKRHANVCDGCFKVIYSLSMKVAIEKNIPFIVTGLSRGQFFETRLTEELFKSDDVDIDKIDEIILNARKAYHKVDDAVKKHINVDEFGNDEVFEKVRFLDFYRYTDVSLEEMLDYLNKKLPWQRPTDTGRSTNCLINVAGIYVHKKKKGYSNYAFPYSWDVRLGHKIRQESLDEINEHINEKEVLKILDEIGFDRNIIDQSGEDLIAYYTGIDDINETDIKEQLRSSLSDYKIPIQFIKIDQIPLSSNGKVDKSKLPLPTEIKGNTELPYVAPRNDIEEILAEIWSEVLNIDKISIFDKFLDIGGNSLSAIRIISRANEAFELELSLNLAFSKPTIASFADFVRETIITLMEQESD